MTQKELILALEQLHLPEEKQQKIMKAIESAAVPKERHRRVVPFAAACTAVFLCVLAALLPRQSVVPQPENPASHTALSPSHAAANPSPLIFNELPAQPELAFHLFALWTDDFRPMTAAELSAYFGFSMPEEFPGGLFLEEITTPAGGPGIFQRKNGEAYFDGNRYVYRDSARQKHLTVTVAKGHLPYADIQEAYDHPMEKSTLNGVEITAASYTGDAGESMLYAEFLYQGNGYFVYAGGVSTDVFFQVLLTLTGGA